MNKKTQIRRCPSPGWYTQGIEEKDICRCKATLGLDIAVLKSRHGVSNHELEKITKRAFRRLKPAHNA